MPAALPPALAATLPAAPVRDPGLPLLPGGAAGLALAGGRAHELCGPARRVLAAMALGGPQAAGPAVLWLLPGWLAERPNPCGLAGFLHPGRLVLVAARRAEDILWAAEEALRSGALPAVVAELAAPPGLTAVRRLHLAAEAGAGAGAGAGAPLCLLLTPGEGGAAGVDSRWHMAPEPGGGWRLTRLRARCAPAAAWAVLPRGARVAAARLADQAGPAT